MNNADKRLKRKVRNSYIVSTVSVALVLFLLGSVGYLLVAAMEVARDLERGIVLTVELRSDLEPDERERLGKCLAAMEPVGSVTFLSKEEKAADAEFRRLFDGEFEEVLGENPLADSFELAFAGDATDRAATDRLLSEIEAMHGVERASFPAQVAERMQATVGKIRLVLLLFGGALLVVSLILLNNTIRLAIYSKRYLINTMKLVGATRWFIMRPFLGSSVTQGIWAGGAASLLFVAAVYGLNETVPELVSLARTGRLAAVVGAMIAGGVLISGLFTFLALNRFINMKSNKIHLY